jgi:hypothetical protein
MEKDPLLRFLAGCAVVAASLAAIVVAIALLIGWQLARDEAPLRATERFLVGDETRYWCLDLKPNDTGLKTLFDRFDEINDSTRRNLVKGTFLESIPLPHRSARLDELAPFTLEISLFMSNPSQGLQLPLNWAARGTFSHGMLRLRAVFKVMRWVMSRDAKRSDTIDVDGITVTEVRDKNAEFALATLGNRVLVASDVSRMRAVLRSSTDTPVSPIADLLALHAGVRLDGEDAWAFLSNVKVGGLLKPIAIGGAAASFDVNVRDEITFRMVVVDGGSADEGSAFRGTREDCSAVVSALLPGIPADAIEIDGDGARRGDDGTLEFSGRISGLSTRLAELLGRVTEIRQRERPSATPTPPSPPPPVGPRTGTPAAPTHEGSPRPPR